MVEEAPTRSSVSLHSLEAWLFRNPAELLTIIAAKWNRQGRAIAGKPAQFRTTLLRGFAVEGGTRRDPLRFATVTGKPALFAF